MEREDSGEKNHRPGMNANEEDAVVETVRVGCDEEVHISEGGWRQEDLERDQRIHDY